MQEPDELNVFEGHEATHLPLEASWLLAQVRQKVDDPAHELHDESQARAVMSSCMVGAEDRRLTGTGHVILGAKEGSRWTALDALSLR